MKTYRVRARYTCHCYVDVEANSEEEAWDKAEELDGGDFTPDTEKDYMASREGGTWELYDCEEV